ncbi:MAG TPA: hypothetical protein VKQ72_16025, partial [Aggregatilineales bacterium]|nr:hypothetical protein [Aggregatilineales bacterium]
MSSGEFTREEIFSQPKTWQEALQTLNDQASALRAFLSDSHVDSVIFTGCGSSYYAALSAASSFQAITAISARGLPASEIWLYSDSSLPANGRALLIP